MNNGGFVRIHMKISHALTLPLRLLHIPSCQKSRMLLSTTLITDLRTAWLLPWGNVILASGLIWSSLSIYCKKYFRVWKNVIASEIEAVSWDCTHTDTHFHHIKYSLGELAIGLGKSPGGHLLVERNLALQHVQDFIHTSTQRTFESVLFTVRYTCHKIKCSSEYVSAECYKTVWNLYSNILPL